MMIVAGPVPAPPSGGGGGAGIIDWHPGFYIGSGTVMADDDAAGLTAKVNEIKYEIDRTFPNAFITGFHFRVTWAHIETSKNTYRWTYLDTLIAYLKAKQAGVRWTIEIWETKFTNNPDRYIPLYLSSETDSGGGWHIYDGGTYFATKACIYKQSITDRYIALIQALGIKYNSDAQFEGMHTPESSHAFSGAPGWSASEEYDKLVQQYVAFRPALATKNVWANINYFASSRTLTANLVAAAVAAGIGVGGPDTFGRTAYDAAGTNDDDRITWAQRAVLGQRHNGSVWVGGFASYLGTTCSRGFQIEEPEQVGYQFGAYGSPWTPADLYDMSHNILQNNHTMVSLTPTLYPPHSPYNASDAFLAFIATGITVATGYPTNYP